jgi:hypothetical protein
MFCSALPSGQSHLQEKRQRRPHGAQVLRGFFYRGEEGGRPITTHFSTLNADEKSEFSTPDVNVRHFSTLNAKQQATSPLAWWFDKKQVFTRAVNRHKAMSLLAWQIDNHDPLLNAERRREVHGSMWTPLSMMEELEYKFNVDPL